MPADSAASSHPRGHRYGTTSRHVRTVEYEERGTARANDPS
ncbi:hypothetical protein [Nocardia sp. Marseille-Q1738]